MKKILLDRLKEALILSHKMSMLLAFEEKEISKSEKQKLNWAEQEKRYENTFVDLWIKTPEKAIKIFNPTKYRNFWREMCKDFDEWNKTGSELFAIEINEKIFIDLEKQYDAMGSFGGHPGYADFKKKIKGMIPHLMHAINVLKSLMDLQKVPPESFEIYALKCVQYTDSLYSYFQAHAEEQNQKYYGRVNAAKKSLESRRKTKEAKTKKVLEVAEDLGITEGAFQFRGNKELKDKFKEGIRSKKMHIHGEEEQQKQLSISEKYINSILSQLTKEKKR